MKPLLWLLFLGLTTSALAQPRVVSQESIKDRDQLYQKYPARLTDASQIQLGQTISSIARQLLTEYKLTDYAVSIQLFVNESGKIDLALYEVDAVAGKKDSVGVLLEKYLPERVADWQIRSTGGKKIQFYAYFMKGRVLQLREIRRGDSLLSTIEDALKIIDTLKIKALHFHQLDLSQVPDVIYRFPNLELLDLHSNNLRSLSLNMKRLPKLKQLDLRSNGLHQDSLHLTKNRSLKLLTLHSNELTDVPLAARASRRLQSLWLGGNIALQLSNRSFGRLRRLQDLNLYGCQLTTLPKGLRKLRKLEILDLYYNHFSELPASLTSLKNLSQLAVANNELTRLPDRMDRLKNLQILYAHHNRLSTLPDRMGDMRNLKLVDIGYNWFSTFPEEISGLRNLNELDISGNNFTAFPQSLEEIPQLQTLHLRGNPFLRLEEEKTYLPHIQKIEKNNTEVFY
ncbi:leucine-rich repeat domain-containing protein [Arundinibacter roseus]|uniref:Leucine-rich repeat domain-containing protein n=1 Tax=Arundinibacter roseus TaxID=2070510 RepID=A0A4R4JZJ9_9BACT|nr:leucine-rich repeat domain-containing protein [Arundinibacter roseus]TDB59119.1 leucine-rich repeat domain-containing protein [Arundinibacter roseus]